MRTILVTGFGAFPGAPYNPTAELVARLVKRRQTNIRVIGHVFSTQYSAVDRELPALIADHRPGALLMFGLHGRARRLRIETRVRNALGHTRDAGSNRPPSRAIVRGVSNMRLTSPAARLLRIAQRAGIPAVISRDAGNYLCNYLCWRAAEAMHKSVTLRLVAFVHVPPLMRKAQRRGARRPTMHRMTKAADAMLIELARCLGTAELRA